MAGGSANEKQPNTVNAEMRRVIIALIENDDPIVTTIIDSFSQAIIAKLVDNTDFTKQIVNSILQNSMVNEVKQEIYESCHMEIQEVAADTNSLIKRITQLEAEKVNVEN